MIFCDEVEIFLKIDEVMFMFGSFLLCFVNFCIWLYLDVGVFVVSYVGNDKCIYYKLLMFDVEYGIGYVYFMYLLVIFVVCISYLCCLICI